MEMKVACISDLHVPYTHEALFQWAIEEVIEPWKPTDMVINGDLLDFGSISKFAGHDECPLEEEIGLGGDLLERVREVCPPGCNRHLLLGNHEERLTREGSEVPTGVQSMLTQWDKFHPEYGNWEIYPYAKEVEGVLKLGPFAFTHGFSCTKTSDDLESRQIANMLETDHLVVVRGHTHRVVHLDRVRNHRHLWRANTGTFVDRRQVGYTKNIDTSTWEPGVFLGILQDGVWDARVVQPPRRYL